jgi:hypothetical protein
MQASFVDYARAVRTCSEQPDVAVIALSVAENRQPTADEEARLRDALVHARANEIMVVASAGNTPGPVGTPGSFPGVFTVAAGAPGAAYCAFASRGPEVELRAPGCGLEEASPFTLIAQAGEGSSQAAAMTAQVAAALRSYLPSLSVGDTETALTREGEQLDVSAVFRAHGLARVIDDGLSVAPPITARERASRERLPPPRPLRLVTGRRCAPAGEFLRDRCRPVRRRFRMRRGRVSLVLRSLHPDAKVEITVFSATFRDRRATRTFLRSSRRFSVPAGRTWRTLRLRLLPRSAGLALPSRPVLVPRS